MRHFRLLNSCRWIITRQRASINHPAHLHLQCVKRQKISMPRCLSVICPQQVAGNMRWLSLCLPQFAKINVPYCWVVQHMQFGSVRGSRVIFMMLRFQARDLVQAKASRLIFRRSNCIRRICLYCAENSRAIGKQISSTNVRPLHWMQHTANWRLQKETCTRHWSRHKAEMGRSLFCGRTWKPCIALQKSLSLFLLSQKWNCQVAKNLWFPILRSLSHQLLKNSWTRWQILLRIWYSPLHMRSLHSQNRLSLCQKKRKMKSLPRLRRAVFQYPFRERNHFNQKLD